MTLSLHDLQQAFAAGVFEESDAVLAHVRDGIFPAARHLQVYRNNTFANLTDALASCYPVTQRLVGEEFFRFLADAYIRRHPPRSGNLHDFGSALAEFVAAFEPAQSLPYLADIARLEWAWQEAYHAPDAPALAPQALAAIPPELYAAIAFRLHPSARLFASMYPCLRIWQVNQPGFDGDPAVDLDAGGQRVLVLRQALEVVMLELETGDYALLDAMAGGKPLGAATDSALAAQPGFDLGAALRRHVATGTLSGFELRHDQEDNLEKTE